MHVAVLLFNYFTARLVDFGLAVKYLIKQTRTTYNRTKKGKQVLSPNIALLDQLHIRKKHTLPLLLYFNIPFITL